MYCITLHEQQIRVNYLKCLPELAKIKAGPMNTCNPTTHELGVKNGFFKGLGP